jgi:group II intron reverse transcriptase/maturase
MSYKTCTNGHGESDRSILPTKHRNKGGKPPADGVEGRERTEENTVESNPCQTQSRESGTNRLDGVRQAAQRDRQMRFTALLHHVNVDLLRDSYYRLKRQAAPGVDQISWQEYGEELEERLTDLHGRIHRGAYRAQPSRRVYIPKTDGRQRPLGIAALEDKIVQQAVRKILEQIYEVDFLGFSYGFRPKRSQHDALDALSAGIVWKKVNWILDADVRGFFDNIDHEHLVKFLELRIGDRRIIRLIRKWLKAGVLEEGRWQETQEGTPQGAVISPLLSNLYLHYVLDEWVQAWRKEKARGDVMIVRYADDFVIGFQYQREAEQFQRELGERLGQFGLELHPDKTRLIEFGRYAAERRQKRGEGKPETFDFLGFTHACGTNHKNGGFEVKRKTMAKRLRQKLQDLKRQMKRRRHESITIQAEWLKSVVRGYFQYHAVPGNWKALNAFRRDVLRLWLRQLRRRSQRNNWTWPKFLDRLAPAIPWPRILHPYPLERFAARHPR